MNYVPFIPQDLDRLDLYKTAYVDLDMDDVYDRVDLFYRAENALTFTIIERQKVYGICGFVLHWPGVCDAWALTSPAMKEKPIAFHKTVLEIIRRYESLLNLHRIQITVREGYTEGQKWAKSLGFKYEGLMHKYTQTGKNQERWARVNGR